MRALSRLKGATRESTKEGMMAAIAAAERGAAVVLLEPNERLGKKLNITGKGRSR